MFFSPYHQTAKMTFAKREEKNILQFRAREEKSKKLENEPKTLKGKCINMTRVRRMVAPPTIVNATSTAVAIPGISRQNSSRENSTTVLAAPKTNSQNSSSNLELIGQQEIKHLRDLMTKLKTMRAKEKLLQAMKNQRAQLEARKLKIRAQELGAKISLAKEYCTPVVREKRSRRSTRKHPGFIDYSADWRAQRSVPPPNNNSIHNYTDEKSRIAKTLTKLKGIRNKENKKQKDKELIDASKIKMYQGLVDTLKKKLKETQLKCVNSGGKSEGHTPKIKRDEKSKGNAIKDLKNKSAKKKRVQRMVAPPTIANVTTTALATSGISKQNSSRENSTSVLAASKATSQNSSGNVEPIRQQEIKHLKKSVAKLKTMRAKERLFQTTKNQRAQLEARKLKIRAQELGAKISMAEEYCKPMVRVKRSRRSTRKHPGFIDYSADWRAQRSVPLPNNNSIHNYTDEKSRIAKTLTKLKGIRNKENKKQKG